MTEGRKLLATEALALVSLLGAAIWQRTSGGIQIELVLLGLLLLPAHLRRFLAWQELAPAPGLWLLLLELGAVVALRAQEVPPLALELAALAGMLPAVHPGSPEGPRARAGRPAVLLACLLALGVQVHAAWAERPLAGARLVLLLPLLVEAWLRGDRCARAELRRAAGCLSVGSLSLVRVPVAQLELASSLVLALVAVVALGVRRAPAAERPRATRRLALRVFSPLVVVVLLVAAGEVAFRLIPNEYAGLLTPAQVAGPRHVPGAVYEHQGALLRPQLEPPNVVRWNRGGWHDVDHELSRAPGVVRILVLGDSYVEGVQVPLDALYHRRLERELATRTGVAVEAISYGWSGWGQRHELSALRDGSTGTAEEPQYPPGLAFDPDLVVVEFLPGNDVRNNLPELEELASREQSEANFARSLFVSSMRQRLFFNAMVWDRTDRLLRRWSGTTGWLDDDVYRDPPRRYPELWARAWAETERQLGQMQALLQPRGAGLVVVGFSAPSEIEHARSPLSTANFDPGLPHRRMAEACARLGLPYLPLPERFARLPDDERGRLHGQGDQHWTDHGHRVGAAETASWLLEERQAWERALARARAPR